MKSSAKLIFILFFSFLIQTILSAQGIEWWRVEYPQYEESPKAKTLPLISVKGNRFVNADGDTVLFRGIAISDPGKLLKEGKWNKGHFEKVKEIGASIVRMPIHPVAWRKQTHEKYLDLLEKGVEWCTDMEMYVILDWHSIGNLQMELFQHPMYNTTKRETYEFWKTIAAKFKGNNTVAFYELFNEPTDYHGNLGRMYWKEWKEINEKIINIIRSYDKETIPLVAGFDWAYDLNPVKYNPIEVEGIGYVSHPYAFKRSEPWEPKWEENFGFAASDYPVFVTEFGIYLEENKEIDENHYANRIINFMEERGISWCGWVFDPEWHPQLLRSWETYELTGAGKFFKEILSEKNKKNN